MYFLPPGRCRHRPLRKSKKPVRVGDREGRPYGNACRGGRPCPPNVGVQYFCRAGPVCPAVGTGEESPSHGLAVPAPFRQGGLRDEGDGLPRARCALAMTHYRKCGASPVRADVGIGPYGGFSIEFRRGRYEHRPAVTQVIFQPRLCFVNTAEDHLPLRKDRIYVRTGKSHRRGDGI